MANKIDIDFFVSSSPYFLKVMDLSVWGLIDSEPSIIEITLPGYESKKTFFFDKCKTNVFNSTTLGINCMDGCDEPDKLTLPDGIYHLKVIGSPSTYNKEDYYLKTDLFDMEVDKIYIDNLNKRDRTNLINKLAEVEHLMKGAHAHIRFDDVTRASMLFTKAQDMIDDLKNCTNCN
jgi:hypothetical protein